MVGGGLSPGVLGTCAALLAFAQAGPLLRLPRETEYDQNTDFSNYTANEVCFSDQRVFQRGEEVPNAGPCEECRCDPPSVVCQMIKCPVNNNGCRTIQQPNHCCPDYNCECDYNGQLYNDGERIDLPEDPCQVCYCKGGDVMCTSVTCYQRDDCEPRHVPGQCCPKFEDCPIRDMEAAPSDDRNVRVRSPNKTVNNTPKREMQPWLLTKSALQTSSLTVPRTEESTTENGNVVIVSDWLIERRVTEDYSSNHTDHPIFTTNQDLITTFYPEQGNVQNLKRVNKTEKVSGTIKPTPIDEVVFTRVDIPRENLEEKLDLTTVTVSESEATSETTISSLSSDSLPQKFKGQYVNINNTQLKNSSLPTLIEQRENELTTISSNPTEKFLPQSQTLEKTHTTSHPNESKNDFVKPKYYLLNDSTKNSSVEQSNIILSTNLTKNETEPFGSTNNNTSLQKLKEPTAQTYNVADLDYGEATEEIAIEHVYGSSKDKSNTTRGLPTGTNLNQSKTENGHTAKDSVEQDITTPNPKAIEKLYFEVDQSKTNNTSSNAQNIEMDKTTDNSFTNREIISTPQPFETTTMSSYEREETTTLYNIQDHMKESLLESVRYVQENVFEDEDKKYNSAMTTDFQMTTPASTTTSNNMNEASAKIVESKVQDGQTETIFPEGPTSLSNHKTTASITSESKTSPNVAELKSSHKEPANYNILEITSNDNFQKTSTAIGQTTDISSSGQTTQNSLSEVEIIKEEAIKNKSLTQKSSNSQESNEQEESFLNFGVDEGSSESREVISNQPPVLELNSHVPFLQLGGDGSLENFSDEAEDHQTTLVSKPKEFVEQNEREKLRSEESFTTKESPEFLITTTTPSVTDNVQTKIKKVGNQTGVRYNDKGEVSSVSTVPVIPLTPGDLKMIAEYLISEKIKPAAAKNGSSYTPNHWLKGNLTSEEKIASILSAANVSIGIMNHSNARQKSEMATKSDALSKVDKIEKETRSNSNSILENKKLVLNKTEYLHNKQTDNEEFSKTTVSSQVAANESKDSDKYSTVKPSTTTKTLSLTTEHFKLEVDNRSESSIDQKHLNHQIDNSAKIIDSAENGQIGSKTVFNQTQENVSLVTSPRMNKTEIGLLKEIKTSDNLNHTDTLPSKEDLSTKHWSGNETETQDKEHVNVSTKSMYTSINERLTLSSVNKTTFVTPKNTIKDNVTSKITST